MRKPVVLVTVHRRYHELEANLRRARALAAEFAAPPDVVVVWACPEVGRLWLFRRLEAEGLVDRVLGRPPLPGEGPGNTTYPESHNLRLGLEYARAHYPPDAYVVAQAADVCPRGGAYAAVDAHMQAGGAAFVCFWPNGCARDDVWHTNFFAVGLDERYWPPVSGPDHADTLERQWGVLLAERRLPGVERSHNSRERFFAHRHESEGLAPVPSLPEAGEGRLGLCVSGRRSPWRRLADWLAGLGVWTRRH